MPLDQTAGVTAVFPDGLGQTIGHPASIATTLIPSILDQLALAITYKFGFWFTFNLEYAIMLFMLCFCFKFFT